MVYIRFIGINRRKNVFIIENYKNIEPCAFQIT
jgi:hypothetical protein